jgi:predicted transcriptional regulator
MVSRRERGELEREVLARLAASSEPMSPSDVQAQLPGDLAYTTVMTTLARMYEKRALERTQRGRAYVYSLPDSPDTAQASMTAYHMQRLLDTESDHAEVLAQFVANLDADDERMLQQLLRDTKRKRPRRR